MSWVWGTAPAAIIVAGGLLRLLHLDADPDYYSWIGYITDEGRWVKQARDLALFGRIQEQDWLIHLVLAPAFQGAHVVVFALAGVSFLTARLPTALAGSALLVIAWWSLRGAVTPRALIVALALLAFEVDLVALSRVAVPEMAAMCLQLAVYALVTPGPATAGRMVLGGVGLLLTVGTKATVAPLVPIFSVMVLLSRWPEGCRLAMRSVLWLWVGFLGPLLAVVLAWLAGGLTFAPGVVREKVVLLGQFVEWSGLYGVASLPFESGLAPVLNLWGLGACLALVGCIVRGAAGPGSPGLWRHYVASATWGVLYLVFMSAMAYFPDRYKVHALLPLAINLASGTSWLDRAGWSGAIAEFRRVGAIWRLLALAALALPTAVVWAPLLASFYGLLGGAPDHLRVRLGSVAAATVCTALVLARRIRVGGTVRFALAFPLSAALLWVLGQRTGGTSPFWPEASSPLASWWLSGGWLAVPIALLVVWLLRPWPGGRRALLVPAVALAYAALCLVRILPSYVQPQYTMREASQDLGRRLAGMPGKIGVLNADALFNGNTLPYVAAPRDWPDILVTAFGTHPEDVLVGYCLLARYELFVSADYVHPPRDAHPGQWEPVLVHRRRFPGAGTACAARSP